MPPIARFIGLAGVAAVLVAAPIAWSCGDKLSAMGGGVRFERIHHTQYPAHVVLYMPADSALRRADSDLHLADLLARTGHTVRIIEARADLELALSGPGTDVVLAGVGDLRDLVAARGGAPAILPVEYERSPSPLGTAAAAAGNRCVAPLGRRSSSQLVRALEDVLQRRSQGTAVTCNVTGSGQGV
jgi:hypothetical protein